MEESSVKCEVEDDVHEETSKNDKTLDLESTPSTSTSYLYCMLNNIPEVFHVGELRNFFSEHIDAKKFDMFHYRHRPQLVNVGQSEDGKSVKKCCCVIRFINDSDRNQFIKRYNGKYWMDKEGNDLPAKCIITKVNLQQEDLQKFANKELRPPSIMPRGNVGTPNEFFLDLIKACRLPPSLIKKLGLEFPRARKFRKYSKVPLDYGTKVVSASEDDEEEEEIKTGKGHEISEVLLKKKSNSSKSANENQIDSDNESNADDDKDRCEEWERHEALHDHRTTHGDMMSESKERLYESEIELQWEKGGPGIVWYTDAQFWDQQKGGFDERTSDDWDVDMEGYYVPGGGDKDARDLIDMRRSERIQKGLETVSVFKKKESPKPSYSGKVKIQTGGSSSKGKIGEFEKYTRGIGRKVMEKFGWKDGEGLGSTIKGIPDALENEGQGPSDRRGFGYYGEKLELGNPAKKQKTFKGYDLQAKDRIVIGTIYDKPEDLDIPEPLKRRNAPTFIKRYDHVKRKSD